MSEWLPLGNSRYTVKGDTLFWKVWGELTAEDARVCKGLIAGLYEKWGYALLFVDTTDGASVPSATRQQLLAGSPDRPTPSHVIVIGASPTIRALAALTAGVSRMAFKRRIGFDFLRTEADGLARLAEVRLDTRKALGLPVSPGEE
jgi:hypothetical protein